MTTYESTAGSLVHVELYSDDIGATHTFFEEAFGWTFENDEEYDYLSWRTPNPPYGGLMDRDGDTAQMPSTLFYIGVDDLAETREAIVAAGGEILESEIEIPEMGVFALYRDTGGVVGAAWEDWSTGEAPEGGWPMFTDEPEAGAITHFEFYSQDPAATLRFYESVYGWTSEVVEGEDYTMLRPPTPPYGAVMQATDEMPVGTMAFLGAESATDACAAVEAAGGRVLREPFEVGDWGTMAVFEAPGGIVQVLWESAPEDMATEPEMQAKSDRTPKAGRAD